MLDIKTNKQYTTYYIPFSNFNINQPQNRKGVTAIKQITAFYYNPYSKDFKVRTHQRLAS